MRGGDCRSDTFLDIFMLMGFYMYFFFLVGLSFCGVSLFWACRETESMERIAEELSVELEIVSDTEEEISDRFISQKEKVSGEGTDHPSAARIYPNWDEPPSYDVAVRSENAHDI